MSQNYDITVPSSQDIKLAAEGGMAGGGDDADFKLCTQESTSDVVERTAEESKELIDSRVAKDQELVPAVAPVQKREVAEDQSAAASEGGASAPTAPEVAGKSGSAKDSKPSSSSTRQSDVSTNAKVAKSGAEAAANQALAQQAIQASGILNGASSPVSQAGRAQPLSPGTVSPRQLSAVQSPKSPAGQARPVANGESSQSEISPMFQVTPQVIQGMMLPFAIKINEKLEIEYDVWSDTVRLPHRIDRATIPEVGKLKQDSSHHSAYKASIPLLYDAAVRVFVSGSIVIPFIKPDAADKIHPGVEQLLEGLWEDGVRFESPHQGERLVVASHNRRCRLTTKLPEIRQAFVAVLSEFGKGSLPEGVLSHTKLGRALSIIPGLKLQAPKKAANNGQGLMVDVPSRQDASLRVQLWSSGRCQFQIHEDELKPQNFWCVRNTIAALHLACSLASDSAYSDAIQAVMREDSSTERVYKVFQTFVNSIPTSQTLPANASQ